MCFIFLLSTLTTSANKSVETKNFPSGWKCYKTIGSYVSCAFIEIWSTWEVWRALKKLELLSATPRATLIHLLCSPNFLRASYLDERMLTYEPIVNWRSYSLLPKFMFLLHPTKLLSDYRRYKGAKMIKCCKVNGLNPGVSVVGDWRFDYLCNSHLQSQVRSSCQSMML